MKNGTWKGFIDGFCRQNLSNPNLVRVPAPRASMSRSIMNFVNLGNLIIIIICLLLSNCMMNGYGLSPLLSVLFGILKYGLRVVPFLYLLM